LNVLPRHRRTHFVDPRTSDVRELRDPDGPPTGRQLQRLNQAGALVVVEPGTAEPLTKAEAAWAVDLCVQDGVAGGTAL
jgi:hypothetical protein